MKKEEKFLIELCNSYINENQIVVPIDIDWKSLYNLARAHNLVGICHCALVKAKNKEQIPKDCSNTFLNAFFDAVYLYEKQMRCFNELKKLFSSSQTPYIAFKGIELREYYPTPESRYMGDIDILIKNEDKDKIKKLLESIGFTCQSSSGTVREYSSDDLKLEIHTRLNTDFDYDAFEYAKFDGLEGKLDDNFHFAYLIVHLAHHLKYTGAGIRLILDLAVMLKEREIDYNKVFEILEKINLTKFGEIALSVCYKWFGYGKCFVDDTEKIEKYLIEDGIFGSLKSSEQATVSRLIQCEAVDNNSKGISLKFKLAFPPYKTLRKAPYLNFLDGRPWLLPVAWVYRFFYNLKNTRKHMIQTIKNVSDEKTNTLAKDELEYFKEIGLI